MSAPRTAALAVLLTALAAPAAARDVLRVDDDAQGADDGSTWKDAYPTLRAAVLAADPQDVLWVAEGTYYASDSGKKKEVLDLVCDAYGGFAGTETSLDQRAGLFDTTVISGDLLGDDGPDFANRDDNSRRVIHVVGDVEFDGFTVRGVHQGQGGDHSVDGGPVLRNCTFMDSDSENAGPLRLGNGSPRFIDCRFVHNRAVNGGAGVDGPTALFIRCEFVDNVSFSGGAAKTVGKFTDCTFERNRSWFAGGAVATPFTWSSGGSRNQFIRCTFVENRSVSGGAVYGRCKVTDCLFVGNEAQRGGALSAYRSVVSGSTFRDNFAQDGGALDLWSHFLDDAHASRVEACRFQGNRADRGGALFRGELAELTVDDSAFEDNQAAWGGAVYLSPGDGAADLRGTTLRANAASASGGALFGCSPASLRRCLLLDNAAGDAGGALYLDGCSGEARLVQCRLLGNAAGGRGGGALAVGPGYAGLEAIDCVFAGNRADGTAGGGGAVWLDPWLGGPTRFVNCTLAYNSALASPGGGGLVGNPFEVVNSVLWGNVDDSGQGQSAQVVDARPADGRFGLTYCVVQGWDGSWPGEGSQGGDPRFEDAAGPDGVPGNEDDDLRPGPGSAALDVAQRDAYHLIGPSGTEPGPPEDAALAPRWVDALDCDAALAPDGVLDAGAYERQEQDGSNVACEGQPNALGVPAVLSGPCAVSLAEGAFTLTAAPVPEGAGALLVAAQHGDVPLGNGVLCLASPTARLATAAASGGALELTVDPAVPPASLVLAPGTTWVAQAFYRDPTGAGFNLSGALTIVVRP